jgi:hypothetical protein
MMNSQPFSSVNSDFVKIRKDFTEIDEKMNALMLEKKNKKLFEECRTMIIEASRKYFVLQGDFRDGKSALIKNDAAQLRQKLEKILYDMPSEK